MLAIKTLSTRQENMNELCLNDLKFPIKLSSKLYKLTITLYS